MKKETESLSSYLIARKVDLRVHKLDLSVQDGAVEKAATAWKNNEEGIRAVIENRMQKIRENLIFDCLPEEVTVKRDILVELALVISDFEKASEESKKRAETHVEELNEEPAPEPDEDDVDSKSSV